MFYSDVPGKTWSKTNKTRNEHNKFKLKTQVIKVAGK